MFIKHANYDVIQEAKRCAKEQTKITQAEIDVAYSCNARCAFCFEGTVHKDRRPLMSYEKVCSVMDELKENGCIYIGFSGGEPFIRDDFLSILSAAKSKGFIVTVVSNMHLLSLEQIDALCEIGVDKVTVSFHSCSPTTYSEIFRVPVKFFDISLNNIVRMIENNQKLSIAVTVTDKNFEEMHLIIDFFTKYGINKEAVNFNLLIQGRSDLSKQRVVLEEYLQKHPELINRILHKNEQSFLCSAGRTSCAISPYGDVYPCTFYNSSAGNLFDNSFKEIWEQSYLFLWLRSLSENDFVKCKSCYNKQWCHICMSENFNDTGYFNTPSQDYCQYRQSISKSLNCFKEAWK